MTNNLTTTKYLLDTNVLFGFSLWKPLSLDLNKFFWLELSNTLKQDKWVLLDVVVNEVKYDTELKQWCKDQLKNGLIKKISDNNRNRAVDINNQYPMIDQGTGKSTVDTYLVAYAEENNLGIFSRESYRENNNKLYKIPDICDKLNIKRVSRPKIFLKEIGFN